MLNSITKILKQGTAALITSSSNRRYLSGFHASDGIVVLTDSRAVFFADSRYFEAAQNTVKNMEVLLFTRLDDVKEYLQNLKIQKILIETDQLSISQLKSYRKAMGIQISSSTALSNALRKSRMLKSESEIDSIIAAQRITDAAFSHILSFLKVGVREKEIALELEFFMRKMGSEGVAFSTIAVSGKNSSLPHGVPTDKKVCSGDFITMDFGAVINGYCSDMTRTVAVGKVSNEQKRVYETVLKAQKTAIDQIKAGKICSDIDKAAREIIDGAGYEGTFGHALGHSVGLDIHEHPNFSPKCNEKLKENMVLTVEPGIYLPNKFGVRIEDMVVVKKHGVLNLTKSPKELIII